ncbi:MAG: hypothetical protein ACKVQS_08505 [Fimbriimonadaceae bacterium]
MKRPSRKEIRAEIEAMKTEGSKIPIQKDKNPDSNKPSPAKKVNRIRKQGV